MKKNNWRANATEVNKSPTLIRFVFVISPGTRLDKLRAICAITTYRTLSEELKLGIDSIKAVDLVQNEVLPLRPELMENFLDEWRENYFNHDWEIPFQFTC